ncbi:hypothetical protein CC2G_002855 [Coprinopsis cinerea AmutBmut pab1-1]|nr:hypothetical protein CC2G_002855 [Coprinopsis cinerea AmutBmut pab1-1]
MLCNTCKAPNIIDGHHIMEKNGNGIYRRIVSTLFFHCKHDPPCRCKVKDNLQNHVYFQGDVAFVVEGMKDLARDDKTKFLKQRKQLVVEVASTVKPMIDWMRKDAFSRLMASDSWSGPFSARLKSAYNSFRNAIPSKLPGSFQALEELDVYQTHFRALLASDTPVPVPLYPGATTCPFSEAFFGSIVLDMTPGSSDALYDLLCQARPEYRSQPKHTVLFRASTLFSCDNDRYGCCGLFKRAGLFPYPEIERRAQSPKVESRFIDGLKMSWRPLVLLEMRPGLPSIPWGTGGCVRVAGTPKVPLWRSVSWLHISFLNRTTSIRSSGVQRNEKSNWEQSPIS